MVNGVSSGDGSTVDRTYFINAKRPRETKGEPKAEPSKPDGLGGKPPAERGKDDPVAPIVKSLREQAEKLKQQGNKEAADSLNQQADKLEGKGQTEEPPKPKKGGARVDGQGEKPATEEPEVPSFADRYSKRRDPAIPDRLRLYLMGNGDKIKPDPIVESNFEQDINGPANRGIYGIIGGSGLNRLYQNHLKAKTEEERDDIASEFIRAFMKTVEQLRPKDLGTSSLAKQAFITTFGTTPNDAKLALKYWDDGKVVKAELDKLEVQTGDYLKPKGGSVWAEIDAAMKAKAGK